MKTTNLKKILLTGSAIVAVGAFVVPGQALADAETAAASPTVWAGSGAPADGTQDGTTAAAGDALDIVTFTVNVNNDGVATDGGGVALFTLGAVTGTTGTLVVSSDVAGTTNADTTATVASVNLTGAGVVTVQNLDDDDATVAATVTDDLTTGGALNIINNDADANDTVTLTVTDNLTVTGATTITSEDGAGGGATGGDVTLDVNGKTVLTGAVTVDASAGEGEIDMSFAENATFTAGVTIEEVNGQAEGLVTLTFDGAAAQTVAGTIDGATAAEGQIVVDNAAGATFTGIIGGANGINSITVEGTAANSAATFKAGVTSAIVLGTDGAGDTNTVTFDGTTAGFTVTGALTGTAAETNNVAVSGKNTIVQATAWGAGGEVDALTVSGNGTILDSNAAITATAVTIGNNATLDVGGSALTGAVALSGTLLLSGAGGVVGAVTGSSGTLDVDANATVTGTVSNLTAVDIAPGVALQMEGSLGATTTTLSGAGTGTLAMGDGNFTLNTNVVTATATAGNVTVDDGAGTTAVTGNIGTSAATLATLDVAGGAAQTLTTTGNLYVDAITVNDADTLSLIRAGAQTVSGTITDGILNVGTGATATDATFEGVIASMVNGTVGAGATARFEANATFTGALSLDSGTVHVDNGVTLQSATQTDADVTTWNIGVNQVGGGAQTNGTVIFTGDAVNLAVDTVNFNVMAGSAPLTVGASVLDDVFQGNAANTIAGATVTDNSYLYSFTLVDDTNNVDVTVAQGNTIASAASTSGNTNVGNQLLTTLAASTNTQINLIQGNLGAAGTATAVNDILEATAPTVDGGAVLAAASVTGQTAGITNTRLASLRNGEAATGMSAGNVSQGLSIWGQAFGSTGDQDSRDGVDGFEVDTLGIAVGIDTETLAEDWVWGLAFSYADSDVGSSNAASTDTDVESYQATLYANYDIDDRTYIAGQLGYSFGDVDSTRHNVGGVVGLNASSDYDSDQIIARLEAGRSYEHGSTTITPKVLANYSHHEIDGYTETGAGGANLTVDTDDLDVFELGVGVEASWLNKNSDGSYLKPRIEAGVRHDLVGDEVSTTSTFSAGGTAFNADGFDPAQTTFNAGAGVTYFSTQNWDLSADYDFEYKSDYDAHSGILRAAYKF